MHLVITALSTLSWKHAAFTMAILGAVILIAGVVILLGRLLLPSDQPQDASLVRSWLAMTLVLALLALSILTLTLDDQSLRSALVGALAANAGAAVAFYFSSKASDQARKDILAATFGVEKVPELAGLTEVQARAILGAIPLALVVDPSSVAGGTVGSQNPKPGTEVRKGSTVGATFK